MQQLIEAHYMQLAVIVIVGLLYFAASFGKGKEK